MHFVQKCEKKRKEIYCDNMIITSITFIFIYITHYYYLHSFCCYPHIHFANLIVGFYY